MPAGAGRLLALASIPPGGSSACGRASKGTQPVQSWLPSQPGTGRVPSPARRRGVRPVSSIPICPAASATIRFCGGLVISAAASRAVGDRAGPVQRLQPGGGGIGRGEVGHGDRQHGARRRPDACRRGRRSPGRAGVSRTRSVTGAAPRTAMVSSRTAKGRGPVRRLVGIRPGQAFDEDVLGIRMGGGEAPGEAGRCGRSPRSGTPGAGGAGQHPPIGQVDPREVPEDRRLEAEMRVGGQQRRAGGGAAAGDRPGVAGRAGQGAEARGSGAARRRARPSVAGSSRPARGSAGGWHPPARGRAAAPAAGWRRAGRGPARSANCRTARGP